MQDHSHQHVFICGLHRSGTSFLHRILAQHPEITGFENTGAFEDEGQHLQTVMTKAYEHGGPGKFAFDPKARLNEDSQELKQADQLYKAWMIHWDALKSIRIEKSPINLIRTRFLQSAFPNAKFIIIKREPIAVSLATKKWSKTSVYQLIKHWLVAHEIYEEDKAKLKHKLEISYENLTAEPTITLAKISEFLGLEVTLPPELKIKPGINDKYHVSWKRKMNLERIFRSKRIIQDFSSRVSVQGYRLEDYL